jgi:mono/diheme cytochrome c family protein
MKAIVMTLAVLFCFASVAWPQAQPPVKTQIQKTSIKYTNPDSGREMYAAYCAVCHGLTGKGDGPAAPALKTRPDLTELSKNNGGKYPSTHVGSVMEFGAPVTAHGSKDMPTWGPLFESLSSEYPTKRAEMNVRIKNLIGYLKTLQAS